MNDGADYRTGPNPETRECERERERIVCKSCLKTGRFIKKGGGFSGVLESTFIGLIPVCRCRRMCPKTGAATRRRRRRYDPLRVFN